VFRRAGARRGLGSGPPTSGSIASVLLSGPAGSMTSSSVSDACHCSSSTRSPIFSSIHRSRRRSSRSVLATSAGLRFFSSGEIFPALAEIFDDPVAVAAMVDRLVHHAEVILLKGDSYRLKARKEVLGLERTC